MTEGSARLARRITWGASQQTYLTLRLLVDRDLLDDSFRAYAYFRWADDAVDDWSRTEDERRSFLDRQKSLVASLYRGTRPARLEPEEEMIADLIAHDRFPESGLHSYIENFLGLLDFDVDRRGRGISGGELSWYAELLARAVTDALLYFIGNGRPFPEGADRIAAARAAHVTHMLRDLRRDVPDGYLNVPREHPAGRELGPDSASRPEVRDWVRSRVEEARGDFRAGKAYIDRLDLRRKIAARWYCARFERTLDAIERDGFELRVTYRDPRIRLALQMAGIALGSAVRHWAAVAARRLHPREHPVRDHRLRSGAGVS